MKKILLCLTFVVVTLLNVAAQSNLYSPSNGTFMTIDGTAQDSIEFTWSADTINSPAYTLFIDDFAGGFASSLLSTPNGSDTSISLGFVSIDNFLATNGYSVGDTANLIWTTVSTNTSFTKWALDTFSVNLIRGIILNPFSNLTPTDGSTILLNGPTGTNLDVTWNSSNTGVTYTWIADVVGGNFSSPIASFASNSSGVDTNLSIGFATLNNLLGTLGKAFGDTTSIIWTVEAKSLSDSILATNSFSLNLVRSYDFTSFSVLSPANQSYIALNGAGGITTDFIWQNNQTVANATYNFSLDATSGNFTNALFTANANSDTSLSVSNATLNSILLSNGYNIGDTAKLHWMVESSNGSFTNGSNTDSINLIVGVTVVPFNLLTQSNGTSIVLNGGTTNNIDFSWNSSGTGNTFEWYLYPSSSFSSAIYSDSSNNMGIDSSIILSYSDLNNMLDTLGYNHGDTAMFNWTVKSSSIGGVLWSVDTFSVNLIRGYIFESFNPTSPSAGAVAIVDGKNISTVDFTWEIAGDSVPEYEFQLDYSFGNFNNPLLSIITTDTSLNVNYDSLNAILVNQGFPLNGTLLGKWRVIAKASGYTKASGTSTISLKRGIIISPFLLTSPLNMSSTIIGLL
jgi:hypothetical protein